MKIKFVNLQREFNLLKNRLVKDFLEVGKTGQYVNGKNLYKFEKKIANFLGVKYCVGVSSWTDGAILVFKALSLKSSDEVITPSNSFIASCGAIVAAGAKPVLADVDHTYNLSYQNTLKLITKKTKVLMPVHLYGAPCKDIFKFKSICKKKNIILIEDAAQSIGASINNIMTGAIGDIGIFSLHPLKNLGVYGDGGIISTNNKRIYEKILLLKNHGLKNRDHAVCWGYNARLSDLNAKFASTKLNFLKDWNKKHRNIAKFYNKNLDDSIIKPKIDKNIQSVFHNYIIRVKNRNRLKKYLLNLGIETSIHYPIPIHLQKPFKNIKKIKLKNTENYSKEILSLPIYHSLKKKEIEYIVKKINFFISKNK
tara:strand:+ start:86 stop:1186 length:1101 start_codon:yes stop_codon:yes gene_type:complete